MHTHPHDRRDEMPVNKRKVAKFRTDNKVTHGVIHQTGVEWGETADQHVRFHIAPEQYGPNGEPLNMGRGWPTGAYTSYVGSDGRRELLLDYEVIGNHCKGVNHKSIGIVAEGAFHLAAPSEAIIQGIVDECLWHEANLGRRLIWTWHDAVRTGWNCPGKFFPKGEVLSRIEQYYIDAEEIEPDGEDAAGHEQDKPRPNPAPSGRAQTGENSAGCLGLLLPFLPPPSAKV